MELYESGQGGEYLSIKDSSSNELALSHAPIAPFFEIPYTYSFQGTVSTTSLPTGHYFGCPNGQIARVSRARAGLFVGSATITVRQNGNLIPGLTNLSVTSTPQWFYPTSVIEAMDGDYFDVIVSAVAGGATNLAVSVFMEFQVDFDTEGN